jgi:putative phage-type endonuclease
MDTFDIDEQPVIVPAQRTDGWHQQRLGRITASRMRDVLAVSKRDGKPLQARQDYMTEKACELLTGKPAQRYQNAAMSWGVEQEPAALAAYCELTGRQVEQVGLCLHPLHEYVGASPDGLMVDRGVEIKCPFNSGNHIATILGGMPAEHMPQVQACMWVCDRPAWDFVSYDPRLPGHMALYVQTIQRNDEYIAAMAVECASFWQDVCEMVASLTDKTRHLLRAAA